MGQIYAPENKKNPRPTIWRAREKYQSWWTARQLQWLIEHVCTISGFMSQKQSGLLIRNALCRSCWNHHNSSLFVVFRPMYDIGASFPVTHIYSINSSIYSSINSSCSSDPVWRSSIVASSPLPPIRFVPGILSLLEEICRFFSLVDSRWTARLPTLGVTVRLPTLGVLSSWSYLVLFFRKYIVNLTTMGFEL